MSFKNLTKKDKRNITIQILIAIIGSFTCLYIGFMGVESGLAKAQDEFHNNVITAKVLAVHYLEQSAPKGYVDDDTIDAFKEQLTKIGLPDIEVETNTYPAKKGDKLFIKYSVSDGISGTDTEEVSLIEK